MRLRIGFQIFSLDLCVMYQSFLESLLQDGAVELKLTFVQSIYNFGRYSDRVLKEKY